MSVEGVEKVCWSRVLVGVWGKVGRRCKERCEGCEEVCWGGGKSVMGSAG